MRPLSERQREKLELHETALGVASTQPSSEGSVARMPGSLLDTRVEALNSLVRAL